MKKNLWMVIGLSMMLLLTGCTKPVETTPVDEEGVQEQEAELPVEQQDEKEIPITVDYASEELLEDTGSFIPFIDETSLNSEWHLVFETDMTVTDFKFWNVDDSIKTEFTEALYTLDEFTGEMPLVVSTYINDATCNRGISFVDADGETRYYTIGWSGMDGSLSLHEFCE